MEKRYVVRVDYNWYFSSENGEEFSTAKVGQSGVTEIRYYSPQHECECHYCEVIFENGSLERIFNINRVYEEPIAANEPESDVSGKLTILTTASEMANLLLSDIKSEASSNSYGERVSDYYVFLVNGNGDSISMQLTEETHSLQETEYYYSLHLVDDVTGKDCDIFSTVDFTEESVAKLVAEVMAGCLTDIVKMEICNKCEGKRYVVVEREDCMFAVERCDDCSSIICDEDAAKLARADGINCLMEYPCYLEMTEDIIDKYTTFRSEPRNMKQLDRYFYLLYRIDWLKQREYLSMADYDEDNGFNGECWVCFDEFKGAELQDHEYMRYLLNDEDFKAWEEMKK